MNSTVASTDKVPASTDASSAKVRRAAMWLVWVIGLAVLWYVIGFGSLLARGNLTGGPPGAVLPLPLYPFGYPRLFLGALVASTIVGLIGRQPNRVVPAVAIAAVTAWTATGAGLANGADSRVFGNSLLLLFGTLLFGLATVLGMGLGVWGASAPWRVLVALSVPAAVVSGYLLGVVSDLQTAFSDPDSAVAQVSFISRWWDLAALFALALAIAAVGKAVWLLLTLASAIVLPVVVTVLGYLAQLIRPGVGGHVAEQLLAPIADLVPAVLGSASTWWPPLAVLAGGLVGLLVWQARRGRTSDVPVLDPANPVTTGDPGGRTPRRGDHDV